MESRMSEDTEGIEKEIESELSRISVSSFGADEPDTEGSEGSVSDTESISDDLPESVLSYLSFIKNRNQDAEKVILQDLEDEEPTDNIREVVPCCASDNLAELTSEYNEDSEQFKKRVLFEMENEDLQVATTPSYNNQSSSEIVTNDLFLTADDEMNISLTYNEVEEKCRQEFEQWEKRQSEIEDDKRRKWKAEREAQEKQNEEEHARRVQHLEKFEAERMELELLHKELIKKLQLRMEQEKRAFEEQKAKESKHLAEQWNTAAVKIQARFRAYLVRKEYAPILKQWKDEIKKKKKIQEEIERELKEREEKMRRRMEERKQNKEEEKKRQEELERQKYLEKMWRQKEYEKKKESLRLEREKELQIREQRKLREKIAKAMITENEENNKENIKEDKLTETVNAIRDEKKELCKEQVKEQNEEQIEMISKTSSGMISTERKLTPTLNVLISEKEDSSQVNDENIYINLVTCAEENYSQSKEVDKASGIHAMKDESVDFGAYHMVENKSNDTCISQSNVQSNATNTDDQDQFSQSETIKKTVFLMRDANEEVIKDWDTFQEVTTLTLEDLPACSLSTLSECTNLQVLTVRRCGLVALEGLSSCKDLKYINVEENKIQIIDCENLENLCILILNKNHLLSICGLDGCINLQNLELSYNRITRIDLRSVITCLSGCSNLRELSLSGNPLLQERNWRIASSIDDVQRQCWYFNQLMKLSIEHRCAHEYGELSTTDRDRPEALQNHLKQTSTDCLQENNLFIMGVTENKQVLLDPSERWITTDHFQATFINSSISVHQKENKKDHRMEQKSTESCINYSGENSGNKDIPAQLTLQHPVIESNMGRDHQCFKNNTESSEKRTMSQNSDLKEKNKFSFRSEKEEKISEEWGFKNISTAQLMLKRAHKMKPRKYSNKNLDPAVRLALFKNNENKHLHVKPPKIQSINDGYFEGREGYAGFSKCIVNAGNFIRKKYSPEKGEKEEFPHLDTTLDEKLQRNDFMYQWLHKQHSDYETANSKNRKG
ncbi:hypothetical protein ASZ78_012830 [Callipepla squamata]|uniref:Leucine-rich repeat and IQ domain-containing protein 1 n=1 Tax=Callipepla squamata TaxID=9009 RepID=A0A226NNP5_CALSU|nr:hypothetical protein ASZ78_012830 [Callipepla squamata]